MGASKKLTLYRGGGGNAILRTKRFYGHVGVSEIRGRGATCASTKVPRRALESTKKGFQKGSCVLLWVLQGARVLRRGWYGGVRRCIERPVGDDEPPRRVSC